MDSIQVIQTIDEVRDLLDAVDRYGHRMPEPVLRAWTQCTRESIKGLVGGLESSL